MKLAADRGHERSQFAEVAREAATLRRIADLETTIARQRTASSDLSARGLPTVEIDRIIDILVVSLELVRCVQAAMDDGAGECAGIAPNAHASPGSVG